MTTKRASLHTLGCRLNNSETHVIRQKLERAGYEIVPWGEDSDLGVINTCTVTHNADQKCRQAIRGFVRKNPDAYTAVVGCYSQMGYKTIADIGGVDLITGTQEKLNVLDYVEQGKNEEPLVIRDRIVRDDFTIDYVGETDFNRRANLKIQDGCNFMCSFCIIPMARGRSRSRQMDNLLEEARSLVARGAKELILTGVNIGTYDYEGQNVLDVVDKLNAIDGLDRLRISSIEPTTIPTELFDYMNDPGHVLLPYLHIPLQAGCDKTLEAMKRKYTLQEFLDFIYVADEKVNDLCIGTDIMVGFPGETDEDFETSMETFREHPFAYSHVFTYSKRDFTPAAKDVNQVKDEVKKARSAALRSLSERKQRAFAESHLGREYDVLFEDPKNGVWPAYTPNYIRVAVESDKELTNTIGRVRLKKFTADFVEAELV